MWQAPKTDYTGDYAPSADDFNRIEGNAEALHQDHEWHDWTPAITGFSVIPPGGIYQYRVSGDECTLDIRQRTGGTSNAITFTISLPFPTAAITGMAWQGTGAVIDNGVDQIGPGFLYISSGGTVLNVYKTWGAGGFTASGLKRLSAGRIAYRIAV